MQFNPKRTTNLCPHRNSSRTNLYYSISNRNMQKIFKNYYFSNLNKQIIFYTIFKQFIYISIFYAVFFPNGSNKLNGTQHYYENINLQPLFTIRNFRVLCQASVCIVIPCRIFILLTQIPDFSMFITFSNQIFRTLFPVLKFALISIIFVVSWSMGLYCALGQHHPDYYTFLNTIYMFLMQDVFEEANRKDLNENIGVNYYFVRTCFFIQRLLLILMYFAVILNSMKNGSDFEFDIRSPFQKQSLEQLENIKKLLDKFNKTTIQQLKGKKDKDQDNKIIIWLCDIETSDQQLITQEMQNADIKLIQFQKPKQVIQFLTYLFQLRPNLLYKSGHYFRIVLDYQEKEDFRQTLILKNHFETFLLLLKERGSTVPVMINQKAQMHEYDMVRFFKIYHSLNFTNDPKLLYKFMMLYPISALPNAQNPFNNSDMSENENENFYNSRNMEEEEELNRQDLKE